MPAYGFVLFIVGVWLFIRTIRGGLVDRLLSL